ncbi:hypothetical protein KC330_g8568 [Hortaea werneckii]|nr:hypothetical protein KC330_g8568 [Hortaea werneckii]
MVVFTDPLIVSAFAAVTFGIPSSGQGLGGKGYVDLSVYGGIPDRKGAGILYGLPNDPAYSPDNAPPQSLWAPFYNNASISYVRAGGAQIPFGGYAADLSDGGTVGYDQRFASARQNYRSVRELDPASIFVLLPHDIWGADSFTDSTSVYPCDDGDCSEYGRFLEKLTADLKSKYEMELFNLIDIWNEPDVNGFWPRSQDRYLQQWDYAYNKYRDAFSQVPLVGPATTNPPSTDYEWWINYAEHISSTQTIPDWYSAHQLLGRSAADCGNDPVDSRAGLDNILQQFNLPEKPFQINEYAAPDEQTPAYTAWFISRFERAGIFGLRANWGMNVGLHNDFARLVGPGGSDYKGDQFYTLGDWYVLNYYTQTQRGLITSAGATGSDCYDLYVTQERDAAITHILAGTRGQNGPYPITVSNVDSLYQGRTSLRAVVKEIPFNNAGRVDEPTVVSETTVDVSNNQVVINLDMTIDSAYSIDLL